MLTTRMTCSAICETAVGVMCLPALQKTAEAGEDGDEEDGRREGDEGGSRRAVVAMKRSWMSQDAPKKSRRLKIRPVAASRRSETGIRAARPGSRARRRVRR
jgi:hypothetical protein